jgi:hypothetical protein
MTDPPMRRFYQFCNYLHIRQKLRLAIAAPATWWAREDGNLILKKVKEVSISSAFTLSPIAVAF